MKITGDEKTDRIIKIGVGVGIAYASYQLLNNLFKQLSPSAGQNPGNVFIPGSGGGQNQGQCNIPHIRALAIRNQMDNIWQKLSGLNLMLYPEATNVILSYDNCEIEYAHNYFLLNYGTTLYQLISGEWDGMDAYTPAINKLKQAGLNF